VTGTGNTFAGTGFRAIDAREGAPMPALYATNTVGWAVHSPVTFLTYLRFHPLAALWLGVLALAVLAWAWSRMRRRPSHPYPASTQWTGGGWAMTTPAAAEAPQEAEEADARHLRLRQPVAAGVQRTSAEADGEPPVASWPGSPWQACEPFHRDNPAGPNRNGREGQW
jgi:hypothetical protein